MKEIITTPRAPEAVGPYAQAVRHGNTLYLSGQLAMNPDTGLFERESVARQTRRCMENIKAVLEAAGSSMANLLSCTVFLSSMDHFDAFNDVYASYFPDHPPARITVASAGIFDGLDVEIAAVAALD
ncbi:RidA family protein [Desulfoluna butyratoxydans]|uniref:Tigr00004: reactive intermediate/imine deaminase n=1 Tax=Desulfoluna butyratoxydans TaxID=231438 RepID=A0A4U8YNR9_9BACT|nr:Rid family detoxifying hydrolase [Desulfoluna butyratoxydans]VFQ42863.1 tigr00004: reactive intermediate/imine deaminase [Desulfoluna butyratoxydans]